MESVNNRVPKKVSNFDLDKLIGIVSTSAVANVESNRLITDLAQHLAISFPASKEKKSIFIDVNAIVQNDAKTGIQRVVRSIYSELSKSNDCNFSFVPVRYLVGVGYVPVKHLMNGWSFDGGSEDLNYPIDFQSGDIFLGLDLDGGRPEQAWNEIRKLREFGVKVFHIVYDLLPLQFKQHFPKNVDWYGKWLDLVLLQDGAICISKAVADDLIGWINKANREMNDFKVSWFHLGADICSTAPSSGQTPETNNILSNCEKRPTFLMVGTVEPRKGHRQVLKAFELLWSRGTDANLVIVGKEGWNVADLAKQLRSHPERGKRLFWPDQASDEFLEQIYAASTCLIAASEGEGFGLPLIEAAQHKLPIIARDIPVFREVAGDHASYFSGKDAENITTAVELWLSNWQNGLHVKSDHLPWLTWAQSAEQLMSVIEKWTAEGRK